MDERTTVADTVTELEDGAVPTPAAGADVRLAGMLARMARELGAEDSVPDTMSALAERTVTAVPGCEAAGVTRSRHGWYETSAATDPLVDEVDRMQYQADQGPCLDALREHEIFRSGDVTVDGRWPEFGRLVTGLGVRSMLSFRLFVEDDTIGSLNLYSRRRDAFDDRSVAVGAIVAAHAALAVEQARARESDRQREQALDSNRRIGIATGILMVLHRIDADTAFEALRTASQRRNRKLRELAEDVISTGAIPD